MPIPKSEVISLQLLSMNEHKGTIPVTDTSGRIGYPLAKWLAESYNFVGFDRRTPSPPFN